MINTAKTAYLFLCMFIFQLPLFAQAPNDTDFITKEGWRNLNVSVFKTGAQDTIYSFIGDSLLYTLILNKGKIQSLDIHHPMSCIIRKNKRDKIRWLEYKDTDSTSIFFGLEVTFDFWRSGRILACNSNMNNIPDGTSFSYSYKGYLIALREFNLGYVEGKAWEWKSRKTYGYTTYVHGIPNGKTAIFNRKHEIIWQGEYVNGVLQ